jgi:peptidoglycan hydrolase CwlO-like protein
MAESIDFGSKIETLKKQYPGYLDNFKEYYILTKQFPNDASYTRGYESSRADIQNATKSLFMINNNIQVEIEKLKATTNILNKNIANEKARNISLQKKYEDATGEVGGAKTMINDYKKIYVLQYISNVSIFLGVILSGVILTKTFRRQTIS